MYTFKKKLINYCIALIPLSLILGNLAINTNVIIICIIGLITYGKKIFFIEDKKYQYLIYAFFLYLIFITFVNNFPKFDIYFIYKENFFKSIFFLRFLLFFLVLNKLIEEGNFNFKFLLISCSFFSFLLAADIIIQVIFGKDLFGYSITANRPSGFFGNENIAGGYLQKFILFCIFLFGINIKNVKIRLLAILFLFLLFLIPITLTGNRMPILMYLGSCMLFFIMEKKFKLVFFIIFFFLLIAFFLIKNPIINRIDIQLKVLLRDSIELITKTPSLFYEDRENKERIYAGSSGYLLHFNSGVQVWKKNKLFGHGIKSFSLNCKYKKNQTCNNHPHNYFIEIMVDVGIVGLIIIYSIFICGLVNYLKFYFSNYNSKVRLISLPFFFITLFEFFPLRSSGSFFTTGNAVIIFFMLVFFINSKKYNLNYKNFKI
jgi:O-antigen ligase